MPFDELETTVRRLAEKLAGLPLSQLAAMKLVVNHGALRFVDVAAHKGVASAIEERDGPFHDYSQAPAERKPNPRNVIVPKGFPGGRGRVRAPPRFMRHRHA